MKYQPKSFILASASPRRAELLTEAGYRFKVCVSPVEEPSVRPESVPLELWPSVLAYIKAAAVARLHPKAVVLGADTIVVLRGEILGKPKDRADARRMLRKLSGQRHEVITGLALVQGSQVRVTRAVAVCKIKRLPAKWLNDYLDGGLWKGKAGAYGIQDHDDKPDPWVTLISGEFSTVVGLPITLVDEELRSLPRK